MFDLLQLSFDFFGVPLVCLFFSSKSFFFRGADVNSKDYKGSTPLRLARRYGQEEIEAILLQKGAKDEQNQGWTRTCA